MRKKESEQCNGTSGIQSDSITNSSNNEIMITMATTTTNNNNNNSINNDNNITTNQTKQTIATHDSTTQTTCKQDLFTMVSDEIIFFCINNICK